MSSSASIWGPGLANPDEFVKKSELASTADGKGAAMVGFRQAGEGAVNRTMLVKGREVVSVEDFGDIGGVDDTNVIQAAINSGHPTIILSSKVQKIVAPIYLPSDITIIAYGSTIDISEVDSYAFIAEGGNIGGNSLGDPIILNPKKGIRFIGGKFVGDPDKTQTAFQLKGVSDVVLDGVQTIDCCLMHTALVAEASPWTNSPVLKLYNVSDFSVGESISSSSGGSATVADVNTAENLLLLGSVTGTFRKNDTVTGPGGSSICVDRLVNDPGRRYGIIGESGLNSRIAAVGCSLNLSNNRTEGISFRYATDWLVADCVLNGANITWWGG